MASLTEMMLSSCDIEGGFINESLSKFVSKRPLMATVATAYLATKLAKRHKYSDIDVVTNTMKFYARTPLERRLQNALVKDLLATGLYRLVTRKQTKMGYEWSLRRKPPTT